MSGCASSIRYFKNLKSISDRLLISHAEPQAKDLLFNFPAPSVRMWLSGRVCGNSAGPTVPEKHLCTQDSAWQCNMPCVPPLPARLHCALRLRESYPNRKAHALQQEHQGPQEDQDRG